jgi:hypothetical protein
MPFIPGVVRDPILYRSIGPSPLDDHDAWKEERVFFDFG